MNNETGVQTIQLWLLRGHPANSNVMPKALYRKLVGHIRRSGRYPPIIVRPIGDGGGEGYEILDGHHRVRALEELGEAEAQCVVWRVDEGEALLLLGTLNRLSGHDDAVRRSSLVAELNSRFDVAELVKLLPEDREAIDKLLSLTEPPPQPRGAVVLDEMPEAVHFFLLPKQRRQLESRLRAMGGTRERALMRMVEGQD